MKMQSLSGAHSFVFDEFLLGRRKGRLTTCLKMALVTLTGVAVTRFAAAGIHLAYLIIYRLVLSPLSSIPSPSLAALTSWHECYYDIYHPAQYAFKIKELHVKYGSILRITPRE